MKKKKGLLIVVAIVVVIIGVLFGNKISDFADSKKVERHKTESKGVF